MAAVQDNRKKIFFANKMHQSIFMFILIAALIPTVFVSALLTYLVFQVMAQEIGMPDAIAMHIVPAVHKVLAILLISMPFIIAFILLGAYKITHSIIGPFDRIVRELDEFLAGTRHEHIILRKTDKFWPLVHKINEMMDKLQQQ